MVCEGTHHSQLVSAEHLASIVLGRRAERQDCSLLDFFALLAPAFPQASRLSFESRFRALQPWGENLAQAVAAAGFGLASAESASGHLRVRCASCGAELRFAPSAVPAALPHRLGCQLDRVRALCSAPSSSPISKRSLRTRRLLTHLRAQLTTTKAQVAREFGFKEDKLCIAIAKRFMETGRPFPDAGALVESLTDICLAEDPLSDVFDGVSRLVQKTPSPQPAETSLKAKRKDEVKGRGDNALRRETRSLLSRTLCRACRSRPVRFVLLPCSHLALCEACAPTTRRCPSCKEEIAHVIRTFRA